jgi:4-hydroxy-3-methylbut-2-enyl diphosphate reductase
LVPEWFGNARDVGVTAGASTPDWILDEVVMALTRIGESLE